MTNQEVCEFLAVKLMEWRRLPASGPMNQDFYENKREEFQYWAEEGFQKENVWNPLEKIEQALGDGGSQTVVGKLAERGFVGIEIRRYCISGKWVMVWATDQNGVWRIGPEADTPSHAISLAAVEALKGKP